MATTGSIEGTDKEKLKRSKKLNPEVPNDDNKDDVPKGLKKTKAGTARRTREKALGTPLPEEDDDEEDSVAEDDAEDRAHDENARSSKEYEEFMMEAEAKEKARYQRRLEFMIQKDEKNRGAKQGDDDQDQVNHL